MLANRLFSVFLGGLLVIIGLAQAPLTAQGRLNDKDLEALMRNLRDDAKSFKSQFNSSISKSTIRKTSREKSAKNLVDQFQKQTEAMLNNFKRTKQGDADVQTVMGTAQQITNLLNSVQLTPQVNNNWQKIQTELGQVASAFGLVPRAENQEPRRDIAPIADAGANAPSCAATVGVAHAKKLVEDCMAVSPATHPSCNVENPCRLIIDEIRRGCDLLGRNAPGYCNEYR